MTDTVEKPSTLELVTDYLNVKNIKYNNIMVDELPSPRQIYPPPVILGTYSHYIPSTQTRYIDKNYTVNLGGTVATYGDVSRAYLSIKYGCGNGWKPRYKSPQWEYFLNWYSVPLMAIPCDFDEGYYIDIKSAWYQIACIVGWDLDYYPSSSRPRWLTMGTPPLDLPYRDIKPLRSSLISVVRPSKMRMWICPLCQEGLQCNPINGFNHPFGSTLIQNQWNNFYNPALWAIVSDVLNGVATDAVLSGCVVYVNNDGFITTNKRDTAKLIQLLRSWGLSFTIKSRGMGWVAGVGNYRVGRHRSKAKMAVNEFVRINRIPHLYWLREKVRSIAEYRRKYNNEFLELFPTSIDI